MPVGPLDEIDEMLVKKYQDKQVNRIESTIANSIISPDRYWEIMSDYAQVQRTMLVIKDKLSGKPLCRPVVNPAHA